MTEKFHLYCVRDKNSGQYVNKTGGIATKGTVAAYARRGSATLLLGGAAWERVFRDIRTKNESLGNTRSEQYYHPDYDNRIPNRDDPDVLAMRETFEIVEIELP